MAEVAGVSRDAAGAELKAHVRAHWVGRTCGTGGLDRFDLAMRIEAVR